MNQNHNTENQAARDLRQIVQLQQRAVEFAEAGMMDEALEAAVVSLGLLEESAPEQHLLKARLMQNTSRVLLYAGDLEQAEAIGAEGVGLMRSLPDCPAAALAEGLMNLSSVQYAAEKLDEATVTLVEAMALWKQEKGTMSVEVADCFNNLGRIREQLGHPSEAAGMYEHVIQIHRELHGDHEQTAFAWMSKGLALMEAGDLSGAEAALQEGVDCCARAGATSGQVAEACAENLRLCREKDGSGKG